MPAIRAAASTSSTSARAAPRRPYRKIDPGKVFDLTLPLEQVAEGYRAMDERRAIKTLHLMFIAFLPFPTAVLAEAFHTRSGQDVATAFYAGTLTVIGVLVTAMWRHVASHRELLSDAISQEEARAIGRRFLVGPTGYGCATVLAFVNPWLSIGLFVALNAYFLWPRQTRIAS
jgi:uncharacterized membrane protein